MGRIAILGGTGPEGLGLGLRFALIGESVVLGSRQAQRAADAARSAEERWRAGQCPTPVRGEENQAAVRDADLVVIATPFAGIHEMLPPLASVLADRLVLDVVNPLIRVDKQFTVERV